MPRRLLKEDSKVTFHAGWCRSGHRHCQWHAPAHSAGGAACFRHGKETLSSEDPHRLSWRMQPQGGHCGEYKRESLEAQPNACARSPVILLRGRTFSWRGKPTGPGRCTPLQALAGSCLQLLRPSAVLQLHQKPAERGWVAHASLSSAYMSGEVLLRPTLHLQEWITAGSGAVILASFRVCGSEPTRMHTQCSHPLPKVTTPIEGNAQVQR